MALNSQLSTLNSSHVATYLIFALQESLYAVDALAVREILWLPELTPLEEVPPYIAGVVNLRGKVVPVMDLEVRLGRPPQPYRISDKVIVMEWDGNTIGVIVSQVRNVRGLGAEDIEDTSAYDLANRGNEITAGPLRAAGARVLAGIARVDDEIVMILSLPSLLQLPGVLETLDVADEAVAPLALGSDHASSGAGKRSFYQHASPQERETLRQRARSLRQPLATQDYAGLVPVAVVVLNGEFFGIDLELVREFSHVRLVTPVPCTPPHIVGQMNLRGDILTLLDIRSWLQMAPSETRPARQVMVVEVDGMVCGVLVDEVLDVVYLRPSDIRPVPAAVQALNGDCLRGTAPHHDKMLGLLDLAAILGRSDLVVADEV